MRLDCPTVTPRPPAPLETVAWATCHEPSTATAPITEARARKRVVIFPPSKVTPREEVIVGGRTRVSDHVTVKVTLADSAERRKKKSNGRTSRPTLGSKQASRIAYLHSPRPARVHC